MKAAFYLTNECNTVVGHCADFLVCSPDKKDNIFQEAMGYLEDIKNYPALNVDTVCFSGGELTLQMDKVLPILTHAKKLGFKTWLKTNGWWGEKADEYLSLFWEAGLDYLRISFDSRRFYLGSPVKRENVLRAIVAGYRMFAKEREFTLVLNRADSELADLRELTVDGINLPIEIQPIPDQNMRVVSEKTGFDDEVGAVVTKKFYYKNFMPTIDFKKRMFTTTEGIAEVERLGQLKNRYVGSLEQESMFKLLQKFSLLTAGG